MKWIFKAGTLFYFLTVSFAQPPEFDYNYSPLSAIVLGQASIEETSASNSDWIAAFDPDDVCAGSSNIFETDNRSNFVLQIYGDDLSTENLDEGLFEGDYFTFSFFDFASNTIVHDTTKYYGWENRNGGWLNLNQNDSLLTLINNLKLNQLQVVGSHNSYHIAPYDTLFGIINAFAPELALSIDYTHLVLPQQFLNYGIRQIELDVYRDPEGGLFSSRLGNWLAGQDVIPDIPELSEPGLKILHFPDIDFDTHLIIFKNGLEKLKIWSDIFQGHVPIFVLIECKSDGLEDYFDDYPQLENLISLLPDSITYTVPLPFDLTGLEEVEAEIRDVFGDSLENIITPDMVRGDFLTLEDAILSGGWPTVGEVRGKIMFGLDNQGSLMDDYMEGYPSLSGRILFTEAPPGTPEAAFLGMNTPSPEITERVNQGYLVRTRADTDTEQARTGDTSRRDEALASGAHFVSTDYYRPDPRHELDPGWTNYSVGLPGEFFSRVNPVNGPPELSGNDLGLINFDMNINFFLEEPVCDEGFIEIGDDCYWEDDIGVLQQFIDNSAQTINMSMDGNVNGVIEPLELGYIQQWEDGRLIELDCGYPVFCGLSGEIPEEIGNMEFLESVRIYVNYLSGPIPESIGSLANLSVLDLNNNLLSGTIPESICDIQPNLDGLSLDFNHLCPPYPECVNEDVGFQDTSQCVSIWHVSTSGSDSNSGSEEFPFATIQHGIDVSSEGDTVLVYPGTFYEAIDFLGKSIVLGSLYILEEDESYIEQTILSNFINISFVLDTELNGFTFQDIYLNSDDGPQAIIYIEDASPKIINNRFDNFYLFQDVESAVIYCKNSNSIIMNNVFTNGSVGNGYILGGYIVSKNSNLTIKNNRIENGYVGFAEPSGYIVSVNSEDIIESNIIINPSMGYCWLCAVISILDESNCTIRNNLIAQAWGDGYGAVVASESQYVSNNNTFVSNSVGYANLSSDGTVSNDIIFGTSNPVYVDENSSIEVTYSDIEGGWEGEGNIDANPLFVSPDNSDYHLQSDSPCIDAGDPNFPNDPDDTNVDMGAYYYNQIIEFPKNIIGYYTSWSVYARDYHVSDIPSEKINFINYAFANINSVTGTIILGDPYADIDKFYPGDCWEEGCLRGSFHQLQLLKADYPYIKTLISVGGWTWSTYFSDVSMTEESREIFAQSCVDFILEYDFDGIDLDWEYPVEGGLGGNHHHPDDGVHLTLLLQRIREMLNEQEAITGRTYYLTIAASANPVMMDHLEVEAISEVLDWINIMSYDFHGPWSGEGDPVTNFNSPLFSVEEDPTPEPYHSEFNLSSSVQNFINRGVPKDKLNAGLAFYGRAFGGVSGGENGLFAPYTGPAGEGTWENGVFDYWDLDIDYIDMNGYSKYWHDGAKVPWLFNPSTQIMVSYDDEESILLKTQYINDENIGGAMFWEFSSDKNGDLLNIVHETVMNGNSSETEEINVSYNGNWNLLSVPDESVDFPCTDYIDGTLYSFEDNSYTNVGMDDITVGQGYWLRFEDMVECTFSGNSITEISVQLTEGWNLMGSISSSVDIASILDEDNLIVPSTIYGFDESYTEAEMIEPGYGYWLRAFQDGEITITSDITARAVPLDFSLIGQANSITVNGMDLYFGLELSEKDRLSYSLPPKPPAGAFDIRFNGDWKLVKDYGELEVKSPHESLSISYDIFIEAGEHMNWVLTSDNGKDYILEKAGKITVPSAEKFILSRKPVIPVTFALHQNFPNPFNPITTLRYDLPSDALVTLSIYDMLGRRVTQLVNTTQEAGFKSTKWDATDRTGKQVSAGVYLYRIEAEEFVQTKKMVLLK